MIVPEEIRKCVAFIGMGTRRRLVGTCSFLAIGGTSWHWTYAATAAHVIEGIRDSPGSDGKVYLRMNTMDGAAEWVTTDVSEWVMHPTDNVADVAVLPARTLLASYDHMSFLISGSSVTQDVIARERIGPGQEVFLTGLFVNHSGAGRNIPIARLGAIAAMPEEPVATARGLMSAYLVEARSIGGLSGSPAFVHVPPVLMRDGQLVHTVSDYGGQYFLGLMHGHWRVPLAVADDVTADGLNEEIVNMGIGIVIPVETVIEVLDQPSLLHGREDEVQARRGAGQPYVSPLAATLGLQ